MEIHHKQEEQGIFGAMIEQAEAPERAAAEKHAATLRKKKQLEEAEAEYQKQVAAEEAEEAAKAKKEQQEAEEAAEREARNSPAAKMLTQANAAASGINMGDIEANIQAQIQAKVASGASKEEIMASMG